MQDTSLSLLERARSQDNSAEWQRLVELYTPLLAGWIRRHDVLQPSDVDDIVQEVLLTVAQELPRFQHNARPGAFRSWLRTILSHRLQHFLRTRRRAAHAAGGTEFQWQLNQLADAHSTLSRQWDEEHDKYVLKRLLPQIERRFATETWEAFRRQVLERQPAAQVSADLGMPLHSVYAAKSRVLAALRAEAGGLVD